MQCDLEVDTLHHLLPEKPAERAAGCCQDAVSVLVSVGRFLLAVQLWWLLASVLCGSCVCASPRSVVLWTTDPGAKPPGVAGTSTQSSSL